MPDSDEAHPCGLTRRDLLKRGAVIGGLIWTAPVIQSVTSRAFAASSELISCCQCSQAPSFPSKIGELSCADCQAYCAGHGGEKSYTRGTGCVSRDQVCVPTDSCPKEPCAWRGTGPVKLKPLRP
jgi:hypothetical protein